MNLTADLMVQVIIFFLATTIILHCIYIDLNAELGWAIKGLSLLCQCICGSVFARLANPIILPSEGRYLLKGGSMPPISPLQDHVTGPGARQNIACSGGIPWSPWLRVYTTEIGDEVVMRQVVHENTEILVSLFLSRSPEESLPYSISEGESYILGICENIGGLDLPLYWSSQDNPGCDCRQSCFSAKILAPDPL